MSTMTNTMNTTTNTNTNTTNFSAPTLSTSAILVHLHIGMWGDRKLDDSKSEELTHNAGAKRGSANVYKSLLPDCAELKAVRTVQARARNYLKSVSMLWTERAHRLLPMSKYQEVLGVMRSEFEPDFNDAVNVFLAAYAQKHMEAQRDLGDLYNSGDYPSVHEVRNCFSFVLEFAPVPEVGHFVVDLQNQAKDELIEQFTRHTNSKWAAAFAGVCEEFKNSMVHLVGKIDGKDNSDKQTRMHPNLVTNIRAMIDKVRTANAFENNADVEAAATSLESLISGMTVDTLKSSEVARIRVRAGVNNILDKFNF